MHKVFISYHHENDQGYKESLVQFGKQHSIFIDQSVDTGDISDNLRAESIREKIRDEYLRDSTVTIVLAGTETKRRKHVDWEIYSSMYDGAINKKSGILAINLPGTSDLGTATHDGEKAKVYPDVPPRLWVSINTRMEYENRYPHMPDRIIDNLLAPNAKLSVVPWARINATTLKFLLDVTFQDRSRCQYDLSRPLRRANS